VTNGSLVGTNVLLDVLTEDPVWLDWSIEALATAAEAGPLFVNPIIYAEVSVRARYRTYFPTVELRAALV
jgi:hypothetical protein